MNNPIAIADLKARLSEVKQEAEALERLIAVYEGKANESPNQHGKAINVSLLPELRSAYASFSVRGRVVEAVIELIHKFHRQVTNQEIMNYVEERGISLGNTTNKKKMLATILSQEIAKKSGKLKRVAHGVFDIK